MNDAYRNYLHEGELAGARYGIGAPRSLQRGLVGSQLGNRSGSSLEFMDHRQYIPGDDLRRIDWNAFARSDKLSIKLYRNEVNPHVDIIIDCSRSMALAGTEKARATLGLAAVFAQAASNSGYSFAAWQVRAFCERIEGGTTRPALWDGIAFDSETSCADSFRLQMPPWRSKGIRVLISDLLWLGDPRETLTLVAERASMVFVVQMLAESDANPTERGNVRLWDSETNQFKDIFIDVVAEKRYKRNLARHQHDWNRGCRQIGAVMTTLIAEEAVGRWELHDLLLAEMLKAL